MFFSYLNCGCFVGVCGLMQCAKVVLCLYPSLGGFAEGQSAHEQFSSSCHYSNSHSPLVKGAITWHILPQSSKSQFHNPQSYLASYRFFQNSRAKMTCIPIQTWVPKFYLSPNQNFQQVHDYLLYQIHLAFLNVSRKCSKMLRSWTYITESAATPVFLQP